MTWGWKIDILQGKAVKIYCWPFQQKENYYYWSLLTYIEKNWFSRRIAAYQLPVDVFIYSSNETTPGTAAAGEATSSEGPRSCSSGQLSSAEAGCKSCRRMWGNCHPCIFQVLGTGSNLCISPGIWPCFRFTICHLMASSWPLST